MHPTQRKLLKLISKKNLGILTLRDISKLLGKNKKTGKEDTAQTVKHHLLQLGKRGLIRIDRSHHMIELIKPGEHGLIAANGLTTGAVLIAIPILGTCGGGEVISCFKK